MSAYLEEEEKEKPVVSVLCKEGRDKEGVIIRHVYPLIFTEENLVKLWDKISQFPIIFGKQLKSIKDFNRYFFTMRDKNPWPTGLFWVIDDFIGVFYLTEIFTHEADAHFTFFDKRLEGREELTRQMIIHLLKEFPTLNRINVSIPCYANDKVFKFVSRVGFTSEGRKRKNTWWKEKWFDSVQFGILRSEILPEESKDGSFN